MSKTLIGNDAFVLPMAQAILGSHQEGRANFMALAWLTRANHKPCIMGICVHKSHASFDSIVETKQFSLNFPSKAMHVLCRGKDALQTSGHPPVSSRMA